VASTDAQASFAINLEDETSGAATSAAQALEALRKQIQGDKQELAALQGAMRNLQGGASVNIKQFRELRDRILAKKQAIADAQGSYLSLGGTFRRAAKGAGGTRSAFGELLAQARGMPGPINALSGKLEALGGLLRGGAIALGITAIVAALAALVAATVAAGAALGRYAIGQADARRSELLRLEGLTKLRNWWGIAAGSATELQSAIDRVSGSTALGREQVAGYAQQLYRMHLRGQNLANALEAVAIKATTQGDAQARMFAGWAAGAALSGRSVKALADDVKARLGGIAARQLLSLDVQAAKLRESFAMLFSGLKLEPFLRALRQVTEMFSLNAATGRALKALLETMFQPLIDSVGPVGLIVKRFFQGLTIGLLETGIVVLRARNWIRDTFGVALPKSFDAAALAVRAGQAAVALLVGGLVIAAGAAAVLAGALGVVFAAVGGAAVVISTPFRLAYTSVQALIGVGKKLAAGWRSTDWAQLGRSLVDGLIGGIKSTVGKLKATVEGLGQTAIKAFRSALGIASPSKVFAVAGGHLSGGVAMGVRQRQPEARRAVRELVDVRAAMPSQAAFRALELPAEANEAPARRAPAAPPVIASPGGRNVQANSSVTIGELHVHSSSERPEQLALDVKAALERALEGVMRELGAPVPEGIG